MTGPPTLPSPQRSIVKRYGLDEIKVTISVPRNKRKKLKKKKRHSLESYNGRWEWWVGEGGDRKARGISKQRDTTINGKTAREKAH